MMSDVTCIVHNAVWIGCRVEGFFYFHFVGNLSMAYSDPILRGCTMYVHVVPYIQRPDFISKHHHIYMTCHWNVYHYGRSPSFTVPLLHSYAPSERARQREWVRERIKARKCSNERVWKEWIIKISLWYCCLFVCYATTDDRWICMYAELKMNKEEKKKNECN